MVVEGGSQAGHAWLVDPMLPSTNVKKFSGTNTADSNNRLVGETCDALAHYSLVASGGSLVLVDIQGTHLHICECELLSQIPSSFTGITVRNQVNGIDAPDTLVLFDLMSHT